MMPAVEIPELLRAVVREEIRAAVRELRALLVEQHADHETALAHVRAALELSVARNRQVEALAERVLGQAEVLSRLAERSPLP